MDARGLRRSALAAVAFIALLGVAAVAPAGASGPSVAPRQADADVYIDVLVDGPPSVRDGLEIILIRDTLDVTSECSPFSLEEDPRPLVRCADLPDGTYEVDVTGVPSGSIVDWDCTDIVAATAPHTAIPIDRARSFTQWLCSVTVYQPGVVLSWETVDTRTLGVVAPDASTIDACEVDGSEGLEIRWCSAGPGDYAVEIVGADGDESTDLSCDPVPIASTTPNTQTVTVTSDGPLGRCQLTYTPQIGVLVNWVAVPGETAEWLTVDAFEVTGGPVGGSLGVCRLIGEAMVSAPNDFGLTCDGLSDGFYAVDITTPPGHRVDNTCDVIEIVGSEFTNNCQIDVFTPGWLARDGGTAPPDADGGDDGDDLPVAGGTVHVVFLLGALLTGVGLLVLSAPKLAPARVERPTRRSPRRHDT